MSQFQLLTDQQLGKFMNNSHASKNTHTHAEAYRLTRWIEVNHASLKGKTQQTIAEDAAEATGLTVTVSNISAVAKTLGIVLGLLANKQPNVPHDISRTLARALCDLYKRLGEEVPDAVHAIANR